MFVTKLRHTFNSIMANRNLNKQRTTQFPQQEQQTNKQTSKQKQTVQYRRDAVPLVTIPTVTVTLLHFVKHLNMQQFDNPEFDYTNLLLAT